jgi:hypothetical protein
MELTAPSLAKLLRAPASCVRGVTGRRYRACGSYAAETGQATFWADSVRTNVEGRIRADRDQQESIPMCSTCSI